MSTEVVPVRAGEISRQEFGAQSLAIQAETASMAVAAQAKAAVEARYILALKKPREWEDVRVRLEKECKRPGFAEVARYRKPIGKGIEGPSIRFAEAALRCMTNVYPETSVIYESDDKRIVQVSVTDLESNLTYSSQVVIAKTVERRQEKDGQRTIGQRTNSNGQTVYIIEATEDDLLNKQNALVSKALRTNALRLLPGDILDACMDLVQGTLRDKAAKDPDAEKRKLIDAFAGIGVGPTDLTAYLGHSLERIQPAEIVELRSVYTAIRDGDARWEEVMEVRGAAAGSTGSRELQEETARKKIELLKKEKAAPAAAAAPKGEPQPVAEILKNAPLDPLAMDEPLSDEQNRELDRQLAESEKEPDPPKSQRRFKL